MPIKLALRAVLSSPRVRRAVLSAVMLLVPAATQTQTQTQTRGCPRFARVPGYGACSNIGGKSCGLCTYRCNDDTVVRWNVCGG